MEAIPLAAISAADCACVLVFHWITRFGVPATVTSDCSLQFTSSLWIALCKMLSILNYQTIAYCTTQRQMVQEKD
jgi:hypothetical protein